MTEALFSTIELESDTHAGYRLHHLEIYNWGTFDGRVWRLHPEGETTLLTGDIGSGKSTLVDAVTTLLLPAHRISYNKAAGAESRERTLRSYVEGHYKSERVEATGASRPIGLRDSRSYSVILGVFVNDGFEETVTLAQVFQQRDSTGQPWRFYVTADRELSVETDFANFGADLNDLRRRLRSTGSELHDDFPRYGDRVRRLLGIRSAQALELLHQTVSMKSVGNLNEFVRRHMLEPADAGDRVRGIVDHFDDLTKAYEAVTRAREQLEALTPLVETSTRYDEALARRAELEAQRDAVRIFIADLRRTLVEDTITEYRERSETLGGQLASARRQRHVLAEERDGLVEARARAGGERLAELERSAEAARTTAAERGSRHQQFSAALEAAGLAPVTDQDEFTALLRDVHEVRVELDQQREALDEQRGALFARRSALMDQAREIRSELDSLGSRTSNLPTSQLQVRRRLCDELGIEESELPFAGELLDVREDFAPWRGAAERVLRGFALSLLVPQRHYDAVSAWVNQQRLTHRRSDGRTVGSRLVYERVADRRVRLQPPADPGGLVLADTLAVADGPFHDYLRNELSRRADYRCVDSLGEFRQHHRAVTQQGQVRSAERHDKDDRFRIDDPRNWTLGWMNEAKIAALTDHLLALQNELTGIDEEHKQTQGRSSALTERLGGLSRIEVYTSWQDLDWATAQAKAEADEAEHARLVAGSSELAEIERRLATNAQDSSALDRRLTGLQGEVSVLEDRIEQANQTLRRDTQFLAEHAADQAAVPPAVFETLRARLGRQLPRDVHECGTAGETLSSDLQTAIDRIGKELGGYSQSILQYMNEVRRRWPEATTEMDASLDARGDYLAFHERVSRDDLPGFEKEFKRQLNTNTIRELAQFNNWLRRQSEEIHTRVSRINEALGAIDYSPGRYITLEPERTINQEVQAFRADLRAATDDTLMPSNDQYSEQRYLQVRALIERFRGREGYAEADRNWTRRVTDVRNWFTFSASERERGTDAEWEHYRDSDGKSGGQKEKLAYTILAASLAYQFGLEWGVRRSRDFRFAVIDEAFGRGSDVSTRYALDLFAKLGLQLLIVTPLQKVHVIEPYVRAIGYVDNPTGHGSRLQTMTIEQFHSSRDQHLGPGSGPGPSEPNR